MPARIFWSKKRMVELAEKIEAGYTRGQLMAHFNKTESAINNAIYRHTFGMRYHRHRKGLKTTMSQDINGFKGMDE